jgi:hypothetical protein
MEPFELLRAVAHAFDKLQLRYVVVGSMASILYGEPRFTNDIDVVAELRPEHVSGFCAEFPAPDYYLSQLAVETAVRQQRQFNLIHPASGLKVDVIVADGSAFAASELSRGVPIVLHDAQREIVFATPEDVILKKLEYYKLGGSEKHLRDIAGIIRVSGDRLDRAYTEDWAKRLSVSEYWQRCLVSANHLESGDS